MAKLKRSIFPTGKIQLIYLLINQYVYHLIVIFLALAISLANIFTPEIKAESFGEKSILFALASGTNLQDEYIEESLEAAPVTQKYLEEESAAISSSPHISFEGEQEEEEKLTTTSEGTALVKPEISTMDVSLKYRDKPFEYTVVEGDTISSIAKRFSISQDTILWENNLTKYSFIKPGQKLVILPVSGISHKIVEGETLSKIAQKYKAQKDKIIEFNKLASESDIQVGQILIIPNGQPYYEPPPRPKLAPVSQIFVPSHVEVPVGEKMAWPTTSRRISQYFSWRHIGLDIDGEFGDPIWAAEDGIVSKVSYLKYGYGYHVILDHGNGKTTLYGHMQKIYVKEGQKVLRGDVLGEMGSTGRSTGSHLHFEVRFGGKRYNPLSYIR